MPEWCDSDTQWLLCWNRQLNLSVVAILQSCDFGAGVGEGWWWLGVEHKVGEILLLGFDAEVVVSDAIPLAVEDADEANDEEERQTDPKTWEANYMESVQFILKGHCKNKGQVKAGKHADLLHLSTRQCAVYLILQLNNIHFERTKSEILTQR